MFVFCDSWCARLWLPQLAQRNLSLPGLLSKPPDSNVRPHALGALGSVHCGVGRRWGWHREVFSYKKTASTLLARGCLLCLFDCLQKLHGATSSPVQKGTIDTVLLYKMAAGKGQFELCSWRGGSSTKWHRFFLQFLYKHKRTCLIVFGWKFQSGCGFQRSKTVDRHYHFVGHEVPRVYGHTILQAGEVVPKPFCRQKGWLATKWTMSTPPRDPANGQEDFI